jgi:hypothetical protein
LTIFDFEKNTNQCGLVFKFDLLGADTIRNLVEHFLQKQKLFTSVGKVEGTPHVVLTKGDGTKQSPYFQLRIASNEVALWTGWYVSHREWREWRDAILSEIGPLFKNISSEFVLTVSSQSLIAVPLGRFKNPAEVSELEALRAFFGRFVPPEFIGRGNGYFTLVNDEGREAIDLWTGGGSPQGEENISFTVRLNAPNAKMGSGETFLTHCRRADELIERFHSGFLSLILKA